MPPSGSSGPTQEACPLSISLGMPWSTGCEAQCSCKGTGADIDIVVYVYALYIGRVFFSDPHDFFLALRC